MVHYTKSALALFLATTILTPPTTSGFSSLNPSLVNTINRSYADAKRTSRRYSAIPYDDRSSSSSSSLSAENTSPTNAQQQQVQQSLATSASNLIENFVQEDDEEAVESLLAKKEERRAARANLEAARNTVFTVTLPLVPGTNISPSSTSANGDKEELSTLVAQGQQFQVVNSVGMSLRQVSKGRRLSELALDVDTLRFQSFLDELQGRKIVESDSVNGENGDLVERLDNGSISSSSQEADLLGYIEVLQNSALAMLEESFDGVVVSSVTMGSLAWEAGIRAGDVLTATSATLGDKLWPKSTLDGVRSAISSRKVISPAMEFEFRRLTQGFTAATEAVETIDLSLSRPIGINVEDTDDGYVSVTGISDKATPVVTENLRVGDRVVSVESSLGGQMWKVYNTDGLISAVTSRLPGQTVRILFERVQNIDSDEYDKENESERSSSPLPRSVLSEAVDGFRLAASSSSSTPARSSVERRQANAASQQMLLSRSRDLLRTYIARSEETRDIAAPVKVADRVLEAVMEASAPLDGRTLSLIMKAYNVCDKSERAITTFEEVFGLAGDGSDATVEREHDGKLVADISALNVFTISALLGAHAAHGDYEASLRVLAAMEGNSDYSVNGKKARSWSGKGDPLNMLPDTRIYNIALASAAKRGTKDGLRAAVEIFESMPNPSLNNPSFGKPAKNLVTFNTMINAFASAGQFENANDVFKALKSSGIRPDRVSYTTLIKASINSGKLDNAIDLLDDMKWVGVQPDIVSYNNVIEALCNVNRLYEAKDLVNEMESARISPDSMTYGLLMKGLLKASKPGPCLTFFESACADERTAALTENVYLYTTAISAAAALGDHERALELVSRMNRAGVKPNKCTLTALMGACIAGGKYDAAVDIFRKIKNPDSYAISVGLQALCHNGNFSEAVSLLSELKSGQVKLTGKQVMASYNNLLQCALSADDFEVSRIALTDLLSAGYIPSKATFRAIGEGLSLKSDGPLNVSMKGKLPLQPEGKFEFLLFVLDSLESRKLTVDSHFYSSILILSAQIGGLHKRIASIIAHSRKIGGQKEIAFSQQETDENTPAQFVTWETLFTNYSDYKKEEIGSSVLFRPVRVSSKDLGRVLAAEQAVSYRGNRSSYHR